MTHEGEPKREAQLPLPEDAGEIERDLYKRFNEEELTLQEALDARPPKASKSAGDFYHDLINLLIIRYEVYRTALDEMIHSTDEHELSLINAYDLSHSELTVFQAWRKGRLREIHLPDAFEISEKLEKAGTPRAKTSLNHFYGWMRNKLAIELGQKELAERRKKKLEENK